MRNVIVVMNINLCTSCMYLVNDYTNSTQPYNFKVEYPRITTLHRHCYSQYRVAQKECYDFDR